MCFTLLFHHPSFAIHSFPFVFISQLLSTFSITCNDISDEAYFILFLFSYNDDSCNLYLLRDQNSNCLGIMVLDGGRFASLFAIHYDRLEKIVFGGLENFQDGLSHHRLVG